MSKENVEWVDDMANKPEDAGTTDSEGNKLVTFTVKERDLLVSMARTNDTIKENMYWEGFKNGGIKMEDDLGSKVEKYEKSFQEIKEYTKNRMPSEQEYRDGTGKVDGINHKGDIEELYSIAKDALDEDKE